MFEKVNPEHPDKLADRIAGAIVDLAYAMIENPRIAVEVLIGHGRTFVIMETDAPITYYSIEQAVNRISPEKMEVLVIHESQDAHLRDNQIWKFRCGDNGIFKGVPVTEEQKKLSEIARDIYDRFHSDGKYILDGDRLIICQSKAGAEKIRDFYPNAEINPIGDWTGGTKVDTGAVNRKLGSDMGDSVTGGGLHGKDLSKADVSVNIYAWLKAQETGKPVEISCAIGDETVDGKPYNEIVEIARSFIKERGGFEKFAEWGLIMDGK